MKDPFFREISGAGFRMLPPVVRVVDPPGMVLRRTTKVECVAPSACPICGFFANQMVEAILRKPANLLETLELVTRFSSYSPEARIDILQKVETRLG